MERTLALKGELWTGRSLTDEIRIELLRKSLHLLIAFVPSLAALSLRYTVVLLILGTSFYGLCEALRLRGLTIPLVSRLTSMAARRRDAGRFVLGPVTLGLGALMALLLYPSPAASIAIYALAFGDGLSSLIGKLFGSIRMPFTGGKSLEGSLTCLAAVFLAALLVCGSPLRALSLAVVATIVEAIPSRDLDNLLLPVITGAAAALILR
ncbi:MAG TPA: phosphatidate cytidylyltransferase [Rectinemataceae bacterium]|nr:phosphatidate cytidylyltransferase [Rectinemataceae bacterium]